MTSTTPDARPVAATTDAFGALLRLVVGSLQATGVAVVDSVDGGLRRLACLGSACADAQLAAAMANIGPAAAGRPARDAEGWIAVGLPGAGGAALLVDRPVCADDHIVHDLAVQAAALVQLEGARSERADAERRRGFLSTLSAVLRPLNDPARIAAVGMAEIRRELRAHTATFGVLTGGMVAVEATDLPGGTGSRSSLPLAAFGPEITQAGSDRAVCFPTRAAAAVPLMMDGRLAAVIHARAQGGGEWSDRELSLLVDASGLVWDERRRTVRDAALRIGEDRLRTVLESVTDGFYALDAEWRFTVFNRAAERFFGMSREEVTGRGVREVFPEIVRSPLEEGFARVMATGVPAVVEMRSAVRPDREVEVRASAQSGGGVAVTFTDVTDRNERVRSLRESEGRLSALVGQARAGIAETTLDGRFVAVNARFCEIVGRSESDLLSLDQASITHGDDLEASMARCREMVATGSSFGIEKRYVRPTGDAVRAASAVGLMQAHGRTTALAVVVGLGDAVGRA